MRKNVLRIASVVLCVSLLLGMTACNGTQSRKTDKISADDPYFSVQEIDVFRAENNRTDVYVRQVVNLGDKIGIMIETYEMPENYNNEYYYNDMPIDEVIDIDIDIDYDEEDVIVETFEEDVMGMLIQPDETELPEDEDEDVDPEDELDIDLDEWDEWDEDYYYDDWSSNVNEYFLIFDLEGNLIAEIEFSGLFGMNDYLTSMTTDNSGNLILIVESMDYTTYQSQYAVIKYDIENQRQISREEIDLPADTWPSGFGIDADGLMYVSAYGMSGAQIIVFDPDGNFLFDIIPDSRNNDYGSIYSIEGQVYVDSYNYSNNSFEYSFSKIDTETRSLEDAGDMTALMMHNPVITEGGIFYNKSGGVYSYDMESGQEELLLSWNYTDLDLSVYSYGSMVPVSQDKIIIVAQSSYYDMGMSSNEDDEPTPLTMAILTREDTNPNAGKTILSIAGLGVYTNAFLTKSVFEFNKSNEDYRIEMKDYMDDFDYSNVMNSSYQELLSAISELSQKLYLDIISGEGPDIVIADGYTSSLERFEAQGLLADLYPYLDKDADFNREDFIQSVLTVYENDGKLYQFPVSFMLEGWVGPTRLIDQRTGWTLEMFNETMESLPEGVMPLVNVSKQNLLDSVVSASMSQFVDFSDNSVDFTNEDFYMILELAKTYGSDIEEDDYHMYSDMYEDSNYVDEWELKSTGRLALTSAYIYSPSSVSNHRYEFGEDITFVGYPSSLSSGPACMVETSFGITSDSPNKDAAWSFVSILISEDAQAPSSGYFYAIPIRVDALEEQIYKALNPEVNEDDYWMSWGGWDAVTEEDTALYRELINSVSARVEGNEQILAIIQEESEAFLNDQKSAEEVAQIIENRVRTFVSERS